MPDSTPITIEIQGAGTMPAGTTSGGLLVAAKVAPKPQPIAGSRFINPQTRDYEIDPSSGQFAQMPPTRQRVLLALMTVFGSSTAKPRFGLRVPDKIRSTFSAEVKSLARSALSHLTLEDARVIDISDIIVNIPRPGTAEITISYTDLLTGETDEANALIRP